MPILHPLNPIEMNADQAAASARVRLKLVEVYDMLVAELPPGRLKSLTLTTIETAAMWATKCIAHEWR
jgi:hypothetical protein